jgi:hypothetical protein
MRQTPTPSQSVSDQPVISRVAAGLGCVLALAAGLRVFSAEARAQPPGPETFGKTPTTPLELWDAADYLVRTGQAPQALPYLNKFLQSKPDDATLMEIRDKYGARSILRLQDHPATRALAEPIAGMLARATRRHATKAERIARFIAALTKSREEQDYAVERLREAGPYAVPELVREISKPSLSAEARGLIVRNMGRLDRSAVPPLIATLDALAAKPRLAADAAEVLGRIGDPRAIPPLTALAAGGDSVSSSVRDAAARAIERITGRPFASQPKSPARLLVDEARRYHTHAIRFPGDSLVFWVWDESAQTAVAKTVSRTDAEAMLGMRYARAALAIDPTDRPAQVVLISLALEKAVERAGFDKYPANDPSNTFASAVAAGPAVLGDVLRTAIADGKSDLAAVAALALGKVTDTSALAVNGQVNPLVEALSAPGRRVRLAAARAMVALDPRRPFAGSSRVVTVLAQFVTSQAAPRALVIDGNLSRGSQLSGHLKALGYEPVLEPTGADGFRTAAESADVELIVIDNHMIQGDWRLHDTLANLKADARTAGIPVYIVGPLARQVDVGLLSQRFPGVRFLVTPTSPQILEQQLAIVGRPVAPTAEERAGYAREAAALLAQIAARPNSPFEPDLARIEPALTAALNTPGTSLSASAALAEVADPSAQRGLADALVDPSKPGPLRLSTAAQLARSIQRFGPLVAADQEAKLLAAFDREPDPALRTALGTVIGTLRPKAASTGLRLRALAPAPTATEPVPEASPSPEAAPSPSEPAKPPAAEPEAKP